MRNIDIALLIYDITNRRSFKELNYWIQEVKEMNNKKILFVVIGNKCDLYEERVIEEEEGKKFANNNNALFFETSAEDYESVENAFFTICEEYLNKLEEKNNNSYKLNK
jgi:small GTP-binding protein